MPMGGRLVAIDRAYEFYRTLCGIGGKVQGNQRRGNGSEIIGRFSHRVTKGRTRKRAQPVEVSHRIKLCDRVCR